MVKSRGSSSGNGSVKSSTTPKSSKSNKTATTYASKYIGKEISNLSKLEIQKSKKNPITKTKWAEKLERSIQKSVSIASCSLFSDDDGNLDSDPVAIQKEIEKLQVEIQARMQSINDIITTVGKKYEIFEDDLSTDFRALGKRSNQFETKVSRITDKFNQVATQVDSIGADLKNRLQSFNNSYKAIEQGLKSSGSSSVSKKSSTVSSTYNTSKADQNSAIYSLNQHLNSKR